MIGRLFNAPTHDDNASAVGTSTIGSSEAIMLAVLAMKKRWQNKRKAEGKPFDKPNIIMNSAVQVCWEKAARYFEVEEKYVYCTPDRFVLDPEEAVNLVDENTVSIHRFGYRSMTETNWLTDRYMLDSRYHIYRTI